MDKPYAVDIIDIEAMVELEIGECLCPSCPKLSCYINPKTFNRNIMHASVYTNKRNGDWSESEEGKRGVYNKIEGVRSRRARVTAVQPFETFIDGCWCVMERNPRIVFVRQPRISATLEQGSQKMR